METPENDVKELKDDMRMLAKNSKNTELVLQRMEKDTETVKNGAGYEKDTLKCTMCEYRCKKEITLTKHFNTKHDNVSF